MEINGYETGDFANWIRWTADQSGNSGGPLVDMTGKVVGINTRRRRAEPELAVPSDTAREVADKILKSAGPDRRAASIAATSASISSRCRTSNRSNDIDVNKGVLVNGVEHVPRRKSRRQDADIMLESWHDDQRALPEELARCGRMIADLPIGTDVPLTSAAQRDGQAHGQDRKSKAR